MVKRRIENYQEDSHKINRLVLVSTLKRAGGKGNRSEPNDVGNISVVHSKVNWGGRRVCLFSDNRMEIIFPRSSFSGNL